MHRIALPDYAAGVLAVFDCADVLREQGADFGGAIAGDKGYFSDFDGGV